MLNIRFSKIEVKLSLQLSSNRTDRTRATDLYLNLQDRQQSFNWIPLDFFGLLIFITYTLNQNMFLEFV